MGDRTTSFVPCPKCGKETDQYDAPSSLMWCWSCESCGWSDPRDYYEAPENVIELITKEEAIAKGLIMECPDCKERMSWWERDSYGKCICCNQNEEQEKDRERRNTLNENKCSEDFNVGEEAKRIMDIFKEFTNDLRIMFLILRHRDGGASNNTKVSKRIVSSKEEFQSALLDFLQERKKNPLLRIYLSANSRNFKKGVRQFKYEMLDADDYDEKSKKDFYFHIKDRFIGCLSQPKAQDDSRFIIDVDNLAMMEEAEKRLKEIGATVVIKYKTRNGAHILTEPFNPNLFQVKDCEVKKNALMLISY